MSRGGTWSDFFFVGITLAAVLRINLGEGGDKDGSRGTTPDGTSVTPARDGMAGLEAAVGILRSNWILRKEATGFADGLNVEYKRMVESRLTPRSLSQASKDGVVVY